MDDRTPVMSQRAAGVDADQERVVVDDAEAHGGSVRMSTRVEDMSVEELRDRVMTLEGIVEELQTTLEMLGDVCDSVLSRTGLN